MIAVCLITSGRTAYTLRTVESFAAHNDLAQFRLLHGDDCSPTRANHEIAARYGFETVFEAKHERVGGHANRRAVVRAAVDRGCRWVLMLENDWESVRPVPWQLFEFCRKRGGIYSLRLYGKLKGPNEPADARHLGREGRPAIDWQPLKGAPEEAEWAEAHWCAPPSITEAAALDVMLCNTISPAEARVFSAGCNKAIARPLLNVVTHIGEERTPGFRP